MKKSFVALFVLTLSLSAFAQNESEHLKFMGIPIDGTMKSFINKLLEKELQYVTTLDDGSVVLTGRFSGNNDCLFYVYPVQNQDKVCQVGVIIRTLDSWFTLSTTYYKLKNNLILKYCEPEVCVEEFQGYTPDDDGSKMTAVKLDRCKYVSIFNVLGGQILLMINHQSEIGCSVMLVYKDAINGGLNDTQAIDDL